MNEEILTRDAAAFFHQNGSTPALGAVTSARGAWLTLTTGHRLLDFHGNSAHTIGHAHPRLIAALQDQLATLPFSPRRYTNETAITLAERLAFIAPIAGKNRSGARVLLAPGGSAAIEIAMKLARLTTGRHRVLGFEGAYHGHGFGPMAVGAEGADPRLGPPLPGVAHAAPPDCFRCRYGFRGEASAVPDPTCAMACAGAVEALLARGDIGALIAEPMRATPIPRPPGYWQRIRAACDAAGTLLVFDEIPTGLGRTGRMFACEHEAVEPDILVLGKALGGGALPLAAVIARGDLACAPELAIGHYTHEKNALMARAGLATLDIIADEGVVERAARLGTAAMARLRSLAQRIAAIGEVRGRGLLIGVDLVADAQSRAPARALGARVMQRCWDAGLSLKISAGGVVVLCPPLTIEEHDLTLALDILEAALIAETSGG